MNTHNLVIYELDELYKIFEEIKKDINFNFEKINKQELLNLKSNSNCLILTKKEIPELNNQIIFDKFPISIFKILEKINIEFIKKNFQEQSEILIRNYRFNINSREMFFKENKLKLTEKEINSILENQSLDVFIDNTGIPSVIQNGYSLVKNNGRVVLVGVPHYKSEVSLNTLPLHFGKLLIGSHGGDTVPNLDIPRYLKLYKNGKVTFKDIISDHYPLESINKAIEAMQDGKTAGRVLINF